MCVFSYLVYSVKNCMAKKLLHFFLSLLLLGAYSALAQSVQKNWVSNPFEQHVFIENKGQFNSTLIAGTSPINSNLILYSANTGGMNIYFTAAGLTYRHDEFERENEEEERKKEDEKEREPKT